jgi:4'-phosphopantetheinyl transferase
MKNDEIKVFLSFLDGALRDEHLIAYAAMLEPQEQARADRLKCRDARRRYLVARALARTVLADALGLDPRDLRFIRNAHGRPALSAEVHGAQRLRFNLSHSESLVALVLAEGCEVGIDVEDANGRDVTVELADRFFAPEEARALRALPPSAQRRRFIEYWTLKEAYMKARGIGLALGLANAAFRFSAEGEAHLAAAAGTSDADEGWRFWQFEPAPGYVGALCAERAGLPQRVTFRKVLPLVGEAPCHPPLFSPTAGTPNRRASDGGVDH